MLKAAGISWEPERRLQCLGMQKRHTAARGSPKGVNTRNHRKGEEPSQVLFVKCMIKHKCIQVESVYYPKSNLNLNDSKAT